MQVIGVMSGSSLDGIDIALVSLAEKPILWKLLQSHSIALPDSLKQLLSTAHQQTAKELIETEHLFTKFIADGINEYLRDRSLDVDLIGVHGHTLWHLPHIARSWQLLNGGMLAELCRCDVVCDFRNQDMALGGQGAPMAILADRDLFPGYDYYLNLGGIANIATYKLSHQAYDLCPCNQLLNHFASELGLPYDDKGLQAQSGTTSSELLEFLLQDRYLSLGPPKSLDNDHSRKLIKEINKRFELSTVDKLRTIVQYISEVINQAILMPNTRVLVTGGGAYNDYLIQAINNQLSSKKVELIIPEDELIENKEAILIAYAAYLRYWQQPNFISSATGATTDVIGGALYTSAYA